MRIYWFSAALVLSVILAISHVWALVDSLYWYYVWLDLPVHFLGGLAAGTFLVGFWYRFRPVAFLLSVIVVAVGWELFEYIFGMPKEANFVFDTAIDLLMDTLGALVAYGIARLTLWRSR